MSLKSVRNYVAVILTLQRNSSQHTHTYLFHLTCWPSRFEDKSRPNQSVGRMACMFIQGATTAKKAD